DSGKTVFFSTHVMEVAEKVCDRIGIINEGLLIAEGTLDELRQLSKEGHKNLEDLFLELTGQGKVDEIIQAL
ncbi:MAG: type transport system ATP-binding protein, partial [Thermotogota bacterium]|nr:type transport system ATP-binding protein [Thermotogota bacterium]